MKLLLKNFQKLFLLMVFLGCAAQGPASGGPEDLAGPIILNIYPENGLTNLKTLDKIEIFFDELVDPLSIPAGIKIYPSIEYKIKIRGKKVIILPQKSILKENQNYRINISKTIRDYRGNGMKAPLNIIYSSNDKISKKYIEGQLVNINTKTYNTVGLYDYPITKESVPKLIVESDNDGNFLFDYIDSGNYTIVALEGKISDFNKQIRLNRYGIVNHDNLDLNNNDFISGLKIFMDQPIERKYIQSIDLVNTQFCRINYNDGEIESYIIPWKNKETQSYYEVGDTINIKLEKSNQLEKYLTPDFKYILSEKNDTIPPKIFFSELNESKLDIIFSEPIKKWKHISEIQNDDLNAYTIFGINDSDTLTLNYDFIDPMSISVAIPDSIEKIQILNYNIKDVNGNSLIDSITTIPITYESDNNLENSLGSIKGEITYSGNEKIILNIENIKSELNYYTYMQNNQYSFEALPAGEYILWGYEVLNSIDENRYFSGTWEPYQRAAKFNVYPDTIEVRARWLIEGISMDIN